MIACTPGERLKRGEIFTNTCNPGERLKRREIFTICEELRLRLQVTKDW